MKGMLVVVATLAMLSLAACVHKTQGDAGAKGDKGEVGAVGAQGVPGALGPQGIEGPAGIQGARGLPGPPGRLGPVGPQGATGPQGAAGEKGDKGDQGHIGPPGPAANATDKSRDIFDVLSFLTAAATVAIAYFAYQTSKRSIAIAEDSKQIADQSKNIADTTFRNAQLAAKAETFRLLRSNFGTLRPRLPKDFVKATTIPDRQDTRDAMLQYWYQSFDEWYITNKLNSPVLKELWDNYYSAAIKVTCQSAPMLAALLVAEARSTVRVDKEFCALIRVTADKKILDEAEKLMKAWPVEGPQTEIPERIVESSETLLRLAREIAQALHGLLNDRPKDGGSHSA